MSGIYRVTAQEKGYYRIDDGAGELLAEVCGRMRHEAARSADYPAVGDFVRAEPQGERAVIECVLPRHSLLVRRVAGGDGEQVIAANIDTLFVCMALNEDFNLRRLERYLAIAWESGAVPVVLLTKADLSAQKDERIAQVRAVAPGVEVLCLEPFARNARALLAPWLGEAAEDQPLSYYPPTDPILGEPPGAIADRQSVMECSTDSQASVDSSRQCRYEFSGESRKTEDFGCSNVWRPTVVDRIGGSRRVRALPGGNSDLWFPNSCQEPAAASGSVPCTVGFVGSSGAGKSTLINRLLGEERLATGSLSADGHGRHTTTRRQMLKLPGGAYVIDTPGMREVGLWDAQEGLDTAFSDVEALARHCRFRDCAHESEPGCAVRAAMETGELDPERYRAYLRLRAENRYACDTQAFLTAKNEKFKKIARINRKRGVN